MIDSRHPTRDSPAVGDVQKLRDFRPKGGTGAADPVKAHARNGGGERRPPARCRCYPAINPCGTSR